MSQKPESPKLVVSAFADQIRGQLVPLRNRFSYFFTGVSFGDDDVKEYLEEPVLALPPAARKKLPEIAILLVPYLERGKRGEGGAAGPEDLVTFDRPETKRRVWESIVRTPDQAALVFAVKDQDVAEYHYQLYKGLATVLAEVAGESLQEPYYAIVREELSANVHGEVDEESWDSKQALLRRQTNLRRKTKGFEKYARQSLIDTLTLYLHGLCCDIDVEAGPRQIASRYLRRRLLLLHGLFPPPDGYALFPEEAKALEAKGASKDGESKPLSHPPAETVQ